MGLVVLRLLVVVLCLAPAGVLADALQARIVGDPWRLTFVGADGDVVLAEAAGRGTGPVGSLGFRTATGWVHATRVLSRRETRDGLELALETTDAQRTLAVSIGRDAEGVVAVEARVVGDTSDVQALGVAFEAAADERFLGFGERSNAVDQRGNVVENYVADGPYQPEEWPLVGLLVPKPGFRQRADATYYPVPWLLSSRGVGVLIDNDETSYFRLGTDDPSHWSVEVVGAPDGVPALPAPTSLRFRVFAGPRPADVLRRFTARTGRQPAPDAPWIFGPWIQLAGTRDVRFQTMAKLRAADAPVSVIQTYTHYLPCGDQVGREDDERQFLRALQATGAAVTTYFNPMLCETYTPRFDQAVAAGALTRDATGAPYIYDYTGSTIFRVGQFDFTTPTGRAFYGRLLGEAIADGHDGWMEDFGEYTPLDAVTAGGLTGSAHHNRYVRDYHCGAHATVRRVGRPVVRFQRSGWTGTASCAQVVWNGDPTTDWGFDGLASAVWNGVNMGLSGVAVWGSDIGGFFALGERALTPELLARWVQFGAVSGVMRTQHNGFAVPAKMRPQIYDDGQIANWKRYAKLRTQLYPYLVGAAAEYRRSGLPIMRHLALVTPDDPVAVARDDEFLFGPDILAAPVVTPGAVTRDVYLPDGAWIDLWRAGTYDSATGSFVMGAATVLAGRSARTVPAPLDELPLFVRAGAVLPLLPPDVDTLADYGDPSPDLVKLRDRDDRLELLAFPRGTSASWLGGSERLLAVERPGSWELRVRTKRRRTIGLQASLATLAQPFVPCSVTWNGVRLPPDAWSWNADTRVLRTRVEGRRGRLRVQAGC
ncbi:MAG TPA: TIM-barrel domain-containing protein [Candidatus Binatia bacterium]|nr:TIM-barrel domain-containing protein [Candidatus Binatia bacterium]